MSKRLARTASLLVIYPNTFHLFWSRGVAVNMPACHAGDRGFDSRRDRHLYLLQNVNMAR